MENLSCCFCNIKINYRESHNPEPLMEYPNRCCSKCNYEKVIPARLNNVKNYRNFLNNCIN